MCVRATLGLQKLQKLQKSLWGSYEVLGGSRGFHWVLGVLVDSIGFWWVLMASGGSGGFWWVLVVLGVVSLLQPWWRNSTVDQQR